AHRLLFAACGLLTLAALAWSIRLLPGLAGAPHQRRLRFACWYWHRPFHLTRDEQRQLRRAHMARLYVYAGTLAARGSEMQLTRRQAWGSAAPCEVYAVIRVHPASNSALLAPDGAAQAGALVRRNLRLRSASGLHGAAE